MAKSSGCTPAASTAWTACTPGDHGGNDRACQFVDQGAKGRILLRGTAHRRKWPDGALPVVHVLDSQNRKFVPQAVIAEVVTERSLRLVQSRVDRPESRNRHQPASQVVNRMRPISLAGPRAPGEGQFRKPFRQRHDRGQGQGGRPADGDANWKRLAAPNRGGVMDTDAAMDLIMEPDLAILHIVVAGELDPIHSQVDRCRAGPVGILGINLGQCDERSAVERPALDLRKTADRGLLVQNWPRSHQLGEQPPERFRQPAVAPRVLRQDTRVDLELD